MMLGETHLSEQLLVFILLALIVPLVVAYVSILFNKRSDPSTDQFSEKLSSSLKAMEASEHERRAKG